MTPNLYQTIYNESAELNTIYLKTTDALNVADFSEQILKINGVNTVTMNETEFNNIKEVINRLYFVIVIMILAAGALAFIVLYNLNNINITERRRELATLKLLGFYDNETAAYVFRENIVLTVLGTILGIFLGIILHKFVMVTVETDIYMFGRELQWYSILIGAILTVIFSLIVNFVMYFKLKKIDMIESLKSVE
jgi:putative ABC transport system permease protein